MIPPLREDPDDLSARYYWDFTTLDAMTLSVEKQDTAILSFDFDKVPSDYRPLINSVVEQVRLYLEGKHVDMKGFKHEISLDSIKSFLNSVFGQASAAASGTVDVVKNTAKVPAQINSTLGQFESLGGRLEEVANTFGDLLGSAKEKFKGATEGLSSLYGKISNASEYLPYAMGIIVLIVFGYFLIRSIGFRKTLTLISLVFAGSLLSFGVFQYIGTQIDKLDADVALAGKKSEVQPVNENRPKPGSYDPDISHPIVSDRQEPDYDEVRTGRVVHSPTVMKYEGLTEEKDAAESIDELSKSQR
jgi:hypothetical protein